MSKGLARLSYRSFLPCEHVVATRVLGLQRRHPGVSAYLVVVLEHLLRPGEVELNTPN